jgi:hypothetical protein
LEHLKRFEAFCDSLAFVNGYFEPESKAYELRNPGLIGDSGGHRVFNCHRAGYAALLDRVQKECKSHPNASLFWLLDSFGVKTKMQQERALDFLSRCSDSVLKLETPLSWFNA